MYTSIHRIRNGYINIYLLVKDTPLYSLAGATTPRPKAEYFLQCHQRFASFHLNGERELRVNCMSKGLAKLKKKKKKNTHPGWSTQITPP